MYHRGRQLWALAVGVLLAFSTGCEDGASGTADGAGASNAPAGRGSVQIDLDEIFPEGQGRDILLNNCQNCHTWVPVVVLQMNETEWARSRGEHRDRVEALGDEEFDILYEYLASNFNPDRPVPELPPALLESWTTY